MAKFLLPEPETAGSVNSSSTLKDRSGRVLVSIYEAGCRNVSRKARFAAGTVAPPPSALPPLVRRQPVLGRVFFVESGVGGGGRGRAPHSLALITHSPPPSPS